MDDNQLRIHLRRCDFRAAKKHVIFAQWAASIRPKLSRETKSTAAIIDALRVSFAPPPEAGDSDSRQVRPRQVRQRPMLFL